MTRDEVIQFLMAVGFVDCLYGFFERKTDAHFIARCYSDRLEIWHGAYNISCLYVNVLYADLTPAILQQRLDESTAFQLAGSTDM